MGHGLTPAKTPPAPVDHSMYGLSNKGPYNPTATLPARFVKKILDLEYVERVEIALDDVPTNTPGQPPVPRHQYRTFQCGQRSSQ